MTEYNSEARQRWGETDAYKEYEKNTADYTNDKLQGVTDGLMAVFKGFAKCKIDGNKADSAEAQTLVKELQNYITENFYTCEKSILLGLGQMYVGDERFKNTIDTCGEGTAEFASSAIKIYCQTA